MKIAIAAFLMTACTAEPPPPEGDQITSFVEHREIPMGFNAQVDILFVIDNTPAMLNALPKLDMQYRAMMSVLSTSVDGSVPDIHLGVVTTNAATGGHLRLPFLADATRFAWRRDKSYDGSLEDAFALHASVGAGTSGALEPLGVALQALQPGVNPGFLRDDAYLALVFITAGDDRSIVAPADAAHALKSLKSDPAKVTVSGAFGACSDGGITASPAPVLDAFFAQFPNRSTSTTLCAPDLTPLVGIIGNLYRTTLGIACLEHVRQPTDCTMTLVDPETDEQLLHPQCPGGSGTHCWSLGADPGCLDGSLAVKFRPWVVPFSAIAILECVADAGT